MRILLLCLYPISNPSHGGQLRVKNIVDFYCSQGYEVEVIGVLGSEHYESEKGFSQFPGSKELSRVFPIFNLMEDFAIGELYRADSSLYEELSKKISFIPDIIHVEQPWLFHFALRYRNEMAPKARLIYGSQNIEWKLKKELFSRAPIPGWDKHFVDITKERELHAIQNSDAIICVSESDLKEVQLETSKPVYLAKNGVGKSTPTLKNDQHAKSLVGDYSYAIYCASAHPPNIEGFFDIFGNGFGSLKPDERLLVVGSAGWAIPGDPRYGRSAKLSERVITTGIVDQKTLAALLNGANVVLLPIMQGGGTNLKTAEAILSGKHVIATPMAMRGYEEFIGRPGIHVASSSQEFMQKLRQLMSEAMPILDAEELNYRERVLWTNTLLPLKELIKELTEL